MHTPFSERVDFTAAIFHASAAGNGNSDPCYHLNVDVPANNNTFGARYLYVFHDPNANMHSVHTYL